MVGGGVWSSLAWRLAARRIHDLCDVERGGE
jgi:hypothetical protein